MSEKKRLFLLFLVLIVFYTTSVFGGGGPPCKFKIFPSAIKCTEGTEGRYIFTISGLYGPEEKWIKWNKNRNWLMRRMKIFSETDSLTIDINNGVAKFYTEKDFEGLLGLFDRITQYTGFVPSYSELVAREWISPNFDTDFFEEIAQFEIEGVGQLIHVPAARDETCLQIRFVQQGYKAFQKNAQFELFVTGESERSVAFSMFQIDSIPYSVHLALTDYSQPDFAEGRFKSNGMGVATLNETKEHCKGHMEHALRVYDEAGQYYWKTEVGLQGASGVWARDLNGDGCWELLVLVHDHGKSSLVVFGKTE